MIPNMIQTQNDGYPERKEPDIEEHEKNVVRVKNSLERKVWLPNCFFLLFIYLPSYLFISILYYYYYFQGGTGAGQAEALDYGKKSVANQGAVPKSPPQAQELPQGPRQAHRKPQKGKKKGGKNRF